ncbi:helix-turn-helix domain-containing protein [Nocardia asiatica]|uniref:helix-turn-helix domain-containing protein n=1 Tax=Nocardia asiatica TaxID=209252 RepID=UPI003CC7F279
MRFGLQRRRKATNRALSRRLAQEELAFKRALVKARQESGLSQTQVADLLGVNKSAISRFERVDSNPTLAMIRHYAHAVGALVTHRVEPGWTADVAFPWGGGDVVHTWVRRHDTMWPPHGSFRVTMDTSAVAELSGGILSAESLLTGGSGWAMPLSVRAVAE